MRHIFAATLLALSGVALAQPPPAPETPPGSPLDVPAPVTKAPAPAPADEVTEEGTTIVGERESPIGQYITPWRNATAEDDVDRQARLLQEDLLPVDEAVFVRQVEYYEALSGALKGKNAVTAPLNYDRIKNAPGTPEVAAPK